MEVKLKPKIEERYDLGNLVTFIPNKRLPIYNWFYFKEGFSRDFVMLMLDEFNLKKKSYVLDPFCGVGTTLLACKERGINCVGVDVAPLAYFVTKVKVQDYSLDKLRKELDKLFSQKFERYPIEGLSPLTLRAFSKFNLYDLIFFREKIKEIKDESIRDFFLLALINASNKASFALKDGSVVKIVDKRVPPLRKVLKRILVNMIKDLKKIKFEKCKIDVYLEDSRDLGFLKERFDAIITSPPYLNKIEYAKVYKIEYDLFFRAYKDSLRSYIGLRPKNVKDLFPELNLPDIAKAYLQDMNECLREFYRVLKPKGKVALVVAEGAFPGYAIVPTDYLIAELAHRMGFKVEKIIVVRQRIVTKDRTVKVGKARESVVILKK